MKKQRKGLMEMTVNRGIILYAIIKVGLLAVMALIGVSVIRWLNSKVGGQVVSSARSDWAWVFGGCLLCEIASVAYKQLRARRRQQ